MNLGMSGMMYPALGAAAMAGLAGAYVGIRHMVRLGQFSYHNARLSASGNPYVLKDELAPLTEMADPSSVSKTVQGPFSMNEVPGNFKDADRVLSLSFAAEMVSLFEGTPSDARPVLKALMLRYEAQELKRVLRSVGLREEPISPIGSITGDLERQLLTSKNLQQAVETLEGHPLGGAILQMGRMEDLPVQMIDLALDRAALAPFEDPKAFPFFVRKGAGSVGALLGDRYNMNLISRAKASMEDRDSIMAQVSPVGTIGMDTLEQMAEAGSRREAFHQMAGTEIEKYLKDSLDSGPAALEISLDRMLLQGSVFIGSRYFSGIGPLIRYVISLEMELRNLRTVYLGSFSGWTGERTRSFLVTEEHP